MQRETRSEIYCYFPNRIFCRVFDHDIFRVYFVCFALNPVSERVDFDAAPSVGTWLFEDVSVSW